ncbi:hypothetical protein BMW23_0667 [Bodo saltans virus]|uniref:Uncharacterized protein n=1 Tax=Bodo saltans virus TaxID=2024608 RepID=A0A2H4UUW1_9VIRU|nr:hypothetical protein QJ851_gp0650 [Bodo saltans virus]ATZ80713.1 hypothetical protein BMW23_0667 [Bodo saltans virus]
MELHIKGKLCKEYNRPFPPTINSLILINHPQHDDNLFLGFVYKYLWDEEACLIILLNNLEHHEPKLVEHKLVDNEQSAKGVFILLKSYAWKYVNISKLAKELNKGEDDINNFIIKRKTQFEMQTVLHDYPITRLDLMSYGIYKNKEKLDKKDCDMDDGIKDESLLTTNGELQLDHLFRERDLHMYDPNEEFAPVDEDIKMHLKKKLRLAERVNDNEMKIIVNKNIAVRNIIESIDDEINEGNKIIAWVKQNMSNVVTDGIKIFGDLKFAIHNGYVHIGRKGINVSDKITHDLVGKLSYLQWQYNIPIDYDTLKYMLFQNDYQKKLLHDKTQRIEVEKILSQEYLLIMQPQPKFLMYTLKRLLMVWYCDDLLTKHIRKIKILINQWRAKSDERFNQQYGVMPMVVIYPRYGKDSARICMTKIADYFLLYNNIAWDCSEPSYAIKVNDLLYYTNGHLDLKLYFRRVVKDYSGTVKNNSFDDEMKKMIGSENLLYPYATNDV